MRRYNDEKNNQPTSTRNSTTSEQKTLNENETFKVEQFNLDDLYNEFSDDLSTEICNYKLKENDTDCILVSTDKAFLKVNGKFQVLSYKSHREQNGTIVGNWENNDYKLVTHIKLTPDSEAAIEGASFAKGNIEVISKKTKKKTMLSITGNCGE